MDQAGRGCCMPELVAHTHQSISGTYEPLTVLGANIPPACRSL